MNTQTHAVLNLALLGRGGGRRHGGSVLLGSLLPDLPMFGFFLWQVFGAGRSQREIWSERYFDPGWQLFFDVFNSVPIYASIACGAGVALWLGSRRRGALRSCTGRRAGGGAAGTGGERAWAWLYFAVAALLHLAVDLPLHREDAHRHWLPLSGWRFESAVSYWDPEHYGQVVSALELLLLMGAGAVLWRRQGRLWARVVLVAVVLSSAVLWAGAYLLPALAGVGT